MPESNPMLRIIAPRVPRVRFKKKKKKNERSFRNRRFFCLLRAMHRTAQRGRQLCRPDIPVHTRGH